jgi:type VI secretion system protein ImpG
MDPRLLRLYEDELRHLRETAQEFGEENEAVAGHLGLKPGAEPDPYVERLLEGVAFLGARVQLKLEDQYPEFTQHLLHAIQPHYLAPTPSMCIAGFEPKFGDPVLKKGFKVPKGSQMTAQTPDQDSTAVHWTTGHDVTLWPIKISEVEYLSSRASVAQYSTRANVRAEAGLRIRLESVAGIDLDSISLDNLSVYLSGSEAVPAELYRQIIGETIAVIGRRPDAAGADIGWMKVGMPGQIGFDDSQALLPADQRSFRGYRYLSEYFACPERFQFIELRGLSPVLKISKDKCDIILLFSRSSNVLANAVEPNNFRLFATPAINLFEKQLARVQITPHHTEFHVVPDRTKPTDFEVFRLTEVKAFARDNRDSKDVAPLYAYGALLYDWKDALFYTTTLRQRTLSTREQRLRKRTDYTGTEVWISLTAPDNPERLASVAEVSVRALCTNRELPELLNFKGTSHFSISGVPVQNVSILRSPTKPRPPLGIGTLHMASAREGNSLAKRGGDAAWRTIAHLTPNYATLIPEDHDDPSVLRDHLALYARADSPELRRQIDGILSVQSKRVTRRVQGQGQGRMAIARGHHVKIKLDDRAFNKSSMFIFGAVVERFLSEFASINSFTECSLESNIEGEFASWPPRIGRRHNI